MRRSRQPAPLLHWGDQVRLPRPEEYLRLLDAHPGLVRWVTLAPEIDGALDLIAALRERDIVERIERALPQWAASRPQIIRAPSVSEG